MAEPWFDPNTFGALYGGIVGGGGGGLGGLLGGLAGMLAPRGIGRSWIVGGMALFVAAGLLSLAAGIAALLTGQPYGIWYPLLLVGAIFTVVMGSLIPVIRRVYDQAEARKLEAESLRRS